MNGLNGQAGRDRPIAILEVKVGKLDTDHHIARNFYGDQFICDGVSGRKDRANGEVSEQLLAQPR
jgi:hypothetical protein